MLVIYNPTAGRRRVRRLWSVLDLLIGHGVRLDVVETRHEGHAAGIAREAAETERGRLVVAAGGDGTVAEVAAGLAGTSTRLGIIPLGTANVLAAELGLPSTPKAVAAMLAGGRARRLWPGLCESDAGRRLFVQMLGVGFDAHVVHHVSRPVKRVLGKGAYVWQTLRELPRYDFEPIALRADGREFTAGSVIVAKGCRYGGPYRLAPEADPSAPGFAVVMFERSGRGAALAYGAALPLDLMTRIPGIRRIRAHEVVIDARAGLPAQADGDAAGATPLRITDGAAPIDVLVAA
ncbi:YegS/Rv2252/BmrU family lipid kinase [Endobacter medicaginis]|uniref:Diacylglycerol kinase family lipid kinase n=1 Tax=Endobacter medicaginis TaxID=1181271 RepID=A0A850NT59_9PROT|nr:diacylglycerol kinase family protein [Endobacter medicaginis]MBB3174122.1 YegS/Rv2252/BmrU family lipid kinase [Endobacter medicaginis]MCX5474166.1 diacylglycerol kinase family protein [Endobacter medicaginis]NVN30592.1 diacylglycerol kinase family lipid kinase [Endobacter medicaginis]